MLCQFLFVKILFLMVKVYKTWRALDENIKRKIILLRFGSLPRELDEAGDGERGQALPGPPGIRD